MATATKQSAVPGIARWSVYAGGIGERHGRNGYSLRTAHGSYHVWPVYSPNRKRRSYALRFANTPQDGGIYLGRGLWADLGLHQSPAAAAKAARAHHDGIEAGGAE